MTYITLRLSLPKFYRVSLLFGLFMACLVVMSIFKDNYWYNTIICYPLGFVYSQYKEKIEYRLRKSFWICSLALVGFFVLLYKICLLFPDEQFQISWNLLHITFGLLIVVLTMKVSIDNSPLRWLGRHLFPIYIYMRLPMIVMESKTPLLASTYPALFILIALGVTLLIASQYKYWEIKL